MSHVAIDNDILFKGACYGLLASLVRALPFRPCSYGVLGAARFMLPKRLRKRPPGAGSAAAIKELMRFLEGAVVLEPNASEVKLAAALERDALTRGLQMDSGESQLCAVVISRTMRALATGDKRAISAIGIVLANEPKMVGRVYCLEQLCARLITSGAGPLVRDAVCANPTVDIALTNCFACTSPEVHESQWLEGLNSYLQAIRSTAGSTLAPG